MPAALFAAMALILNDGVIFLLKLYFQQTRPAVFLQEVLPGMLLSLAGVVLFFPLSWWIAKAGGDRNG